MTKLLIDGDLLIYRAAAQGTVTAFGVEYVNQDFIAGYISDLVEYVKDRLFTKNAVIVLSGRHNFRKTLVPTYKSNRKDRKPPAGLPFAYEYVMNHDSWEVLQIDRLEADDVLGLLQTDDTILCSTDKDLDQIPGHHYNWRSESFYKVDEETAYYNFWRQVLSGDPTDGYYGIPRVGKKTAVKLLRHLKDQHNKSFTDIDFWKTVVKNLYEEHGLTEKDFYDNAVCAYILRGDEYDFDTGTIHTWLYSEEVSE